jgi:hypothetical protein
MILGIICSCTESIDVFSQSEDLVLIDIILRVGEVKRQLFTDAFMVCFTVLRIEQ